MVLSLQVCGRGILLIFAALVLMPGTAAFTVDKVVITPSGVVNPGDAINVSCTVYAAEGVAFPSYDDIQFVTELDDPVWTYVVMVNGVENVRPAERGKTLTVSGFELNYEDKDEVVVKVQLRARVPATAPVGETKIFLTVQEIDARNKVIQSTVVKYDHLIGTPTPTPTPAFGSIGITSEPPGASVYVDNVIKGITPLTLDGVPNGGHAILLRLDGYQDYTDSVIVMADARQVNAVLVSKAATPQPVQSPAATGTPGTGVTARWTTVPVTAESTPAPTTGTLSVITDPPGALVYIDGEMKGISPATIPGLSAGSHSVVLIMDGYQDFKTTTMITPGMTAEFVTGLAKRKAVPGFTAAAALGAIAMCGAVLMWGRKRG